MPLHEYRCQECGAEFVELVGHADTAPCCPQCGASDAEQLLSAPGAVGLRPDSLPDAQGHGCCGSRPGEKGCVPGSCCGKAAG
ncbi:MAG: zinc ribbon domain-containing protein [Desulfovibrio sp.]|nr:zinc ribbon domain-containing protein [Desulfovibrio sp.]